MEHTLNEAPFIILPNLTWFSTKQSAFHTCSPGNRERCEITPVNKIAVNSFCRRFLIRVSTRNPAPANEYHSYASRSILQCRRSSYVFAWDHAIQLTQRDAISLLLIRCVRIAPAWMCIRVRNGNLKEIEFLDVSRLRSGVCGAGAPLPGRPSR